MFEDNLGNALAEIKRLNQRISELTKINEETKIPQSIHKIPFNEPSRIVQWQSGPPIRLNNVITYQDYGSTQEVERMARLAIARNIADQIVAQDLVDIQVERDIRTRELILRTEFYVYNPPR